MFDTLRNARMKAAASAGIVVLATMIGAGVAAADTPKKVTEVSLQNALKVTVEVTFTGAEALQKNSPWNSVGDKTQVVGNAPDGATIKWEAKPKHDADKNHFTICKGEKKVSGPKATIVMSPDSCTKADAAPKTGTGNTQTNNKKPPSGPYSNGGSMDITFENTTDDQSVDLRIWDDGLTGVITEISSIPSATNNGKPWSVKNTSTTNVKKDNTGKYSLDIVWNCRKSDGSERISHGGSAKYRDSVSKILIVKTSDGGCDLKNVTKVEKKDKK